MDAILTYTSFIIFKKKLLACFLYLQVTLPSDINNIKGTSIMNTVLIGSRNKYRHNTYDWSLQQKPSIQSWNLWHRTLRKKYF